MTGLRLVTRGGTALQPRSLSEPPAMKADKDIRLDEYLPFLINRVASTMIRFSSGEFEKFGDNVPTFRILMSLRQVRSCRFGQLALMTCLEQPSLHRHLAMLTGRGFVRRAKDPGDARTILIKITPAGLRHTEKLLPSANLMATQILREISDNDAQRLRELLRKIYSNLQASAASWGSLR